MILLITSSRTWIDPIPVINQLSRAWCTVVHDQGEDLHVMHGDCRYGGDRITRIWTGCKLPRVHELRRPAAWNRHDAGCGKPRPYGYCPGPTQRKCNNAGFRRNTDMVEELCTDWVSISHPVLVLAFIRDNSRGATHCATQAEVAGLPVRRIPWPHPAGSPAVLPRV